jgi:hypothetical protein
MYYVALDILFTNRNIHYLSVFNVQTQQLHDIPYTGRDHLTMVILIILTIDL